MSDASTGAMQQFAEGGASKPVVPGLVLLYAEEYAAIPAAWPLLAKNNGIGRDPEQELFLPVHAVSRTHCSIQWDRDGFTLRDLGSTNGTLVDGRRAFEARLEHGCEVRIGDAILKFVARDADRMRHYRIDGALQDLPQRQAPEVTSLVGGYQMDSLAAEIQRIAKTPLSVMVLGESGTGKEVVARELHRLSQRRGGFCAVNCAAIPANLLESELFGYKKGAFSGADRDKPGLIKTAHQGTLLLDEIGDMPSEAQAKLLRVLQSREVFPLGATAPEAVDVRVICATHRDLGRLREQGKFRDDLFARLNEYQLRLPPLRDRKEDIHLLARAFLDSQQRGDLQLTFPFMTGLLHYDWPHNVRELESCMKRSVAVAQGPLLEAQHLPPAILEEMQNYGSPLAGPAQVAADGAPSDEALRELLQRHQGNVAAVGRELGKARMQVHRWLKRYEIDLDEYR
jgi:transcriptional regulator with PAS, ATPase and Fis domain